ncbi:MAG: thymidine kinase, partial [Holosporales bacterium]
YNYRERGMDTLMFIPSIDTRAVKGRIASRIGLEKEAHSFDSDFDFFAFTEAYLGEHKSLACILIDEAQFLKKEQVEQLCRITDELNVPVLAYGLRTDFKGEPFEGSKYLMSWAENLYEIKTICHCGRKATMNARVDAEGRPVWQGNQIEIGGNERYVALCRKHFFMDKPKVKEAA